MRNITNYLKMWLAFLVFWVVTITVALTFVALALFALAALCLGAYNLIF